MMIHDRDINMTISEKDFGSSLMNFRNRVNSPKHFLKDETRNTRKK